LHGLAIAIALPFADMEPEVRFIEAEATLKLRFVPTFEQVCSNESG
jgi:hypothetical protein